MGPTRVWAIRPEHPDPVSGDLRLTAGALEFTPADPSEPGLRVPRDMVRRARRHLGTPVIDVGYVRGGESREVLLYFAMPAPLSARGASWVRRRMERTGSVAGLASANRDLKPVVREWAGALSRAARERRRS